MSYRQDPENSIKMIHAALDAGTTLFNTNEFYTAGGSGDDRRRGNARQDTENPVDIPYETDANIYALDQTPEMFPEHQNKINEIHSM